MSPAISVRGLWNIKNVVCPTQLIFSLLLSPSSTAMTSPHRRPLRAKSRRMASSLSLILFAFFALICLCPAVSAQDTGKKSEYGTVIGIGTSSHYALISAAMLMPRQIWEQRMYWLFLSFPPANWSPACLVIHVLGESTCVTMPYILAHPV